MSLNHHSSLPPLNLPLASCLKVKTSLSPTWPVAVSRRVGGMGHMPQGSIEVAALTWWRRGEKVVEKWGGTLINNES